MSPNNGHGTGITTAISNRVGEVSTKEFLGLFIFLAIGLGLTPTLNGFAETASISTFPVNANAATIYGLIPLFIAILFIAAIGGVAYVAVTQIQRKSRQAYQSIDDNKYNPFHSSPMQTVLGKATRAFSWTQINTFRQS